MFTKPNRKLHARIRHRRIRRKLSGSAARPRLAVYRSGRHMYAQLIDDTTGKTLASASTLQLKVENGATVDAARKVGEAIAAAAKGQGIEAAVYDRGGFLYHGRVAALAEAAREAGLQF